jgi:hypothetical protein
MLASAQPRTLAAVVLASTLVSASASLAQALPPPTADTAVPLAPPGAPQAPAAPPPIAAPAPFGSPIAAAPPPYFVASEQPPPRRWYGWQILIPALAGDALVYASAFAGGNSYGLARTPVFYGLFTVGLLGRGIAGPIVHLAHGHLLKALASLGLDLGLPGAVAITAFALPCGSDDGGESCYSRYFTLFIGVPITLMAGLVVDTVVLAKDPVPRAVASPAPTWSLAPVVLPPSAHGARAPAGLAVVGSF